MLKTLKKLISSIALGTLLLCQQTLGEESLSIASWNLQRFGKKKASNPVLLNAYQNVITNYDIIFLQEVDDSSGNNYQKLAFSLPQYFSYLSAVPPKGQTERTAVLARKTRVNLRGIHDYAFSNMFAFTHPPLKVDFKSGGYSFSVWSLHTSPKKVNLQLSALEKLATARENTIIIGDLNADGIFFKSQDELFRDWLWPIHSKDNTTLSPNNNYAYDRVLLNPNARREYLSHEIRRQGISSEMSDHYPISVRIIPRDR